MITQPNPLIIELGQAIHDALLEFVDRDHHSPHDIYHDLSGGCAVGAAFLTRAIRNKLRLRADFVAHEHHCWVESGEFIYDPTALQFAYDDERDINNVKVRCLPIEEAGNRYSDYETKRISFVNREWPPCQRPNSFSIKWEGKKATITWTRKVKRRGGS